MNEGYDVKSKDDAGSVLRYIEVKSSSDEWNELGVALSKPQFDKATEEGDRFWLYVVEKADKADFRIYRIRDPARLVNQFMYDHAWRGLAEQPGEHHTEDSAQGI